MCIGCVIYYVRVDLSDHSYCSLLCTYSAAPPTITGLDFSFSTPVLIINYNITGWPPPRIQWLKETSALPNSWFILDTDITLNDVGIFTGSRVINPVGPNTDGLYTLIATNSEGTVNRTVNVTGSYFLFDGLCV